MINPINITDYGRSDYQLEEFLLFCIMVAGKRADTTSRALDDFLRWIKPSDQHQMTPFTIIKNFRHEGDRDSAPAIRALDGALRAYNKLHPGSGIGQYGRMARAFWEAANLPYDLREVELKDLMRVHGIGPKTARLFLLHTRQNQRLAVLDVHVLRYIKGRLGEDAWVPSTTPSNPNHYAELEQFVLRFADEAGMTPAQFDLWVWTQFAVAYKEQ